MLLSVQVDPQLSEIEVFIVERICTEAFVESVACMRCTHARRVTPQIRSNGVTSQILSNGVTPQIRSNGFTTQIRSNGLTENEHTIYTINDCRYYLICCNSAATSFAHG